MKSDANAVKKVRQAVSQWYGSTDWEKEAKKRQSARIGTRGTGTGLKACSTSSQPHMSSGAKSDGECASHDDLHVDKDFLGKGKDEEREQDEMRVDDDDDAHSPEDEVDEDNRYREADIHYDDQDDEDHSHKNEKSEEEEEEEEGQEEEEEEEEE